MCNWNKPLPKNTKVNYYECYAKILLEEIYPNEFMELQIADKPDLQSKDNISGIEVTISEEEEQLKAESLYTDICYDRVRNVDGAIKEIKKCGCKLEKGILIGKPGKDSFDLILKSFSIKLNKLNGNEYKNFKKNCLFIFSDILPTKEMINDAIKEMIEKQLNKKRKFYKVYILIPGGLYSFNLDKDNYELVEINSSLQSLQACKARELVEKYQK